VVSRHVSLVNLGTSRLEELRNTALYNKILIVLGEIMNVEAPTAGTTNLPVDYV
jgi:hypothetical protein